VIVCVIASIVAVTAAQLILPFINTLIGKQLSLSAHPILLVYVLLASLMIGLVAGLFPAFYMSAFKPIAVLKGLKINQTGTLNLRKALVVLQFTISIVLIIG